MQKAVTPSIPVFLINAEITKTGLAKAQIVSNNAQGAALGAQQWAKAIGDKGKYVELFGKPDRQQRPGRSNGYETVHPSTRTSRRSARRSPTGTAPRATTRCSRCCRHPDIIGVIAGNDEMALGAIAALKEAKQADQGQGRRLRRHPGRGRRGQGRRDGSTVLQPIVEGTEKAVTRPTAYQDRQDRVADGEAALRLHPDHQGQRRRR